MALQLSAIGRYSQIVHDVIAELDDRGRHVDITAVHDRLKALAGDDPGDVTLRALADGCGYRMVSPDNGTGGVRGPFAPISVLSDDAPGGVRVYPLHLEEVEQDILDVWAGFAAERSVHPLVRARLADLLWVRRHQPDRRWFQAAVEAYVQLADTEAASTEVGYGLRRAVEICAESNHSSLSREPLEALRRLIERTLASDKNLFGVCWRALQTLADSGSPFLDLLAAARKRFGSDPDYHSELLDIAIGASRDANEIEGLRLEQIAVHETAAASCAGLLRVSRLDTARGIAASGGLTEHVNRLTAMIERTDMTGAWHTTEETIEIEAAEIRSQAARIVRGGDVMSALVRFAQHVPTGDPERSRRFVTEMANEHPLLSMVTRLEFGPEGGVTRKPTGHEDRIEADLGAHDAQAIMVFAATLGEFVLRELRERHGPDLQPMLAQCFREAPAIREELAEQIATSFKHWANDEDTAAGSMIVGVVEPLVRGVCRQLGINVTRLNGQVRTLGTLLSDLSSWLHPGRARYLEAALVDPRSLNLRNRAAHGLDSVPPRCQFVVVFHIACVLMCISCGAPSDTQTDPRTR